MTPTERAVIQAARDMRTADLAQEDLGGPCDDLMAALAALDAATAAAAAEPGAPTEITWGEVVTTDEVLSGNGRWYEVLEIRNLDHGVTLVRFKTLPPLFTKGAGDPVTVRRSEMGHAVDTLNTILLSGPS